ncbi:DDB1- and CUL4-associated factor 13 [Quillaja saponaria]|uniref:DDB1- and CUL4-associated factor 13 n=1 Tax=Quillaja saponaria TaxID=32244 RepID=A0AAD7PJG7_QUISA|nr:DDB1- and CUL4-associated factor 13 [Quillaja saponaria]
MKVKVISRSTDEFTRERSQDLQRVFRNYDPSIRPQEKAVEYVRALNAAKLDKTICWSYGWAYRFNFMYGEEPKSFERNILRFNGWRYSSMGHSFKVSKCTSDHGSLILRVNQHL